MKALARTLAVASMAVALLASTAAPGHAALIYTLNLLNIAGTGPFGTVTVSRVDATHATIVFQSNLGPVGTNRYVFGDGSSVAFNLNGAGTVSVPIPTGGALVSAFTPAHTAGPMSFGGSGTVDGWGSFSNRYDNFDGFNRALQTVTFNLTKTSGTWASDADILTPNSDGHSVAAHIFISNLDMTSASATGFATDGVVPEPTTILALGTGLMVMGAARRRRSRKV